MNSNRILLIFGYLWYNTDETHTVSIADITQYLLQNGVPIKDPRTIRSDIADLISFGVDIVVQRKVQNRYFIGSRHFEAPEIKLLIDAVQSSRFITPKKSKALIDKLSTFVAPNQAEILNRQLYIEQRSKADNESVYLTVDDRADH